MFEQTRHITSRRAALTLIECMIAIVILSLTVLATTYAANAGLYHLEYSGRMLRAVRLAENLTEEIQCRPYHGSGGTRTDFCIDDYNNFNENPGELTDATGTLYDSADQIFSRTVSVTPTNVATTDLDGEVFAGKRVIVTVNDTDGEHWQLERWIAEPY